MREIECCFGGGSDPGAAPVLIPCEGESRGENTGDDRGRLAKNNLCDPPWICSRKGMTGNPFRGNKRKQREGYYGRKNTSGNLASHRRESIEYLAQKFVHGSLLMLLKGPGRHFCPE